MEIVNFGKQGFANRFCRELADSIASTWVRATGSEAEGLPHYRATRGLTLLGSADSPGPLQTLNVGQPQIGSTSTFYFLFCGRSASRGSSGIKHGLPPKPFGYEQV